VNGEKQEASGAVCKLNKNGVDANGPKSTRFKAKYRYLAAPRALEYTSFSFVDGNTELCSAKITPPADGESFQGLLGFIHQSPLFSEKAEAGTAYRAVPASPQCAAVCCIERVLNR